MAEAPAIPPMTTTAPIAMPAAAPLDSFFFDDFSGDPVLELAAVVVTACDVVGTNESTGAVEVMMLTGVVAGVCEVTATGGGTTLALVDVVDEEDELVLPAALYSVVNPTVSTIVLSSVSVADVTIALVDVNIDSCVPTLLDIISPRELVVL